ncbi:iron-containing alcohol dehydrogenase [Maridesulfovibrio sp.]|uniref:iron-containing alcohol dehydrogenase family protein n=1 Tax=Maridesulfovibrio sp. TaxID=2795000 RepID=UPI002A18B9F4|nr:iron-containing alcohol dehydrogenase [Maridesulfovibrio sp.]
MKIYLPVDVIFCASLEEELNRALEAGGYASLCVLTGIGSARKSGLLDRVEQVLKDRGTAYFDAAVNAEPDSDAVDMLAGKIARKKVDAVIALGGGSVMDAAKSAALLAANSRKFEDVEFGTTGLKDALPVLAVPTVSGSGSECTPYAVINNSRTGRKSTIGHRSLFPTSTLICPELSTGVSAFQTASGAFDTLIHCFESHTGAKNNFFADSFAIRGAGLVFAHLCASLKDPGNILHRQKLAEASMCGGAAIAHARTGAIHTLSVALQKYSPLPHGMLNAALFRPVAKLNREHYAGRAMEFMTLCGFRAESDAQAVHVLDEWIRKTYALPETVFSVPEEEIGAVIDRFKQDKGLAEVNPAPMSDPVIEEFISGVIHAQGQ